MRRLILPVALAWLLLWGVAVAGPLRHLDGTPGDLSQYTGSGSWLVVMIWESNCRICNAEVYQYVDFQDMHVGRDASVLGISIDTDVEAARAFIDRHSVSFPNLIGAPADVARLYTQLSGDRFVGTPTFLLFDPQGVLRARQAGAVPSAVIERFIAGDESRADAGP